MAFIGISLFSLIAAGAGLFSLNRVNGALNLITEERVPEALTFVEIARQAERIISAAPSLLVVTSDADRQAASESIRTETEKLNALIDIAGDRLLNETNTNENVAKLVENLNTNLVEMDSLVAKRLTHTKSRENLIRKLQTVDGGALRVIAPAERKLGAQTSAWRRSKADNADQLNKKQSEIAKSVIELLPQRQLSSDISAVSSALSNIASSNTVQEIDVLIFPLRKAIAALQKTSKTMPRQIQRRLVKVLKAYDALADGEDSIPVVRRDEIITISAGEKLLQANSSLAKFLSQRIDFIVNAANEDISRARSQAEETQKLSVNILIGVGILSLVSSLLIIWLYVGRVLIARLSALSDSMLAIAGGNLKAKLPKPGTDDEIGRMGEALIVFRDTAVEVEASNLKDIETARGRLVDAIENSSEGFAFYDPQGDLVICNSRYNDFLFPNGEFKVTPGVNFEKVIHEKAYTGLIEDAVGREEEWIAEEISSHDHPGEPRIQLGVNGQWILISDRKTGDGGTVTIYSDITDLKSREKELSEKSNALEQLSNQLAKYLSPQIYNSIFSGKQEVKLVSQRKRLTIFFSDLVGFTETTERLESEDLTRLLNQYLTEMSDIAIAHGATIDKYIGDAIVIFFGDPDTLGVKEDAVQCVKMAIAMRERMNELERLWKDSGLEKPLQCRIGINTGVATVGNFGSDERMDYTIIGGGVNLAARLEGACEPGEILLSYETYAHVKDLIDCEEREAIKVKGIAAPVTTYQVLDLFENMDSGTRPIRANLPFFNLEMDFSKMNLDEQKEVLEVLKDATEKISQSEPAILTETEKIQEN